MWGIWMIFNIILKFSPFTQLGVSESIQRNVPILIAENKLETVRINQNNAYGFSWLMGTVLLVAFMLLGPSLLGIDKTYCYLFAPILLFNLISYNIGIVFRSHNQFKKVGIVSFLSGLLSLISVFLAYKLSFFGFLIGQLVRYILTFLIFYLINKVTLNLEVKLTYIKGLIVDGTPIILIVLSSYLVTLSDRLIIANYFDDKSLGLYGLAYLVINPFLLISGSVNSVLYTSFSSSFGKDKTFLSIGRVFRYTKVLIFIYSACIGLVYLLLPLVTSMFLPDYTDGIDAAKWLLVGHIFYFSGGILTNSYFTLNKQKNRLLIVLLALFVNITMSLILLKYIPDIVSVALGSVCSFIVLFGGLLFGLRFMSHFRNSDQLKGLGLLISFLVGGIVILVFLGAFEFHSNLVIDGLLKVLSFIIVYTVWAFLFNKSDLKKLGV